MSSPLNRRQLLAGTAAVTALSALPSSAQPAADTANLSGKSILITGCSSGFGYAGALHYARQGAKVIATMRNLPRAEAVSLQQEAETEELDIHIVEIDVLSDESVANGVAEAERIIGGAPDVLINNAGIGTGLTAELQDMVSTQLMFDTNVFGYQRMVRAVLPGMRARGSGQIFAVSSQLGRLVVPGYGLYCATKFAVEAHAEQLAYELVPHGIEVTIIQPGGYPTDIWRNANRYTEALLERASDERKAAYPGFVENALQTGGGRNTDPMDIPRAIAEIIAMPDGSRPLRRAVHPRMIPQEAINSVSSETQIGWLGQSPYGPWVRAAHSATPQS